MNSKANLKGIVERRLFDQAGNPKKQFKDNFLWKLLKSLLGLDLQIPFLTGFWTFEPIKRNTITTVGKQVVAKRIGGVTQDAVTAVAIGTGTPTTTALGGEISTNGGDRAAATVTNQTTSTTGDTCQWVISFTFTGSFAVTEEGLFDTTTSSSGNMLASQSFSAINVVNTDVLQITHKVIVS